MSAITVDALFYSAYREAGMVPIEGTGLNDDQTEECRTLFNRMIDRWRGEGTTIYHIGRTVFPITPGKGDYNIGPSQDFDCPWPMRLERAGIILTSETVQPEYPIFPLTLDEWQYWTLKQQATNWPRRFFYEKSYPIGIVHLLYVPTDANNIALYMEQPLDEITATGDELIDLPPVYQEAVETNLAVRIAARNPGRSQISPMTVELAKSSLDQVRTNNARPLKRTTDLDRRGGCRSNVYSGNRYGGY